MDIPKAQAVVTQAVVAIPESRAPLAQMPDQPDEQTLAMPEDGEDLCCELPHPSHADSDKWLPQQPLSREKAQRMAEFIGFLADPLSGAEKS